MRCAAEGRLFEAAAGSPSGQDKSTPAGHQKGTPSVQQLAAWWPEVMGQGANNTTKIPGRMELTRLRGACLKQYEP